MNMQTNSFFSALILFASIALSLGANKSQSMPAAEKDIPPCIVCWHVIHDNAGHSGYACIDGRRNFEPPNGGGLYPTIQALQAALQRAGWTNCQIIPKYGGKVYEGWKIESLTVEELHILQAK
jgi:hypothetical protein